MLLARGAAARAWVLPCVVLTGRWVLPYVVLAGALVLTGTQGVRRPRALSQEGSGTPERTSPGSRGGGGRRHPLFLRKCTRAGADTRVRAQTRARGRRRAGVAPARRRLVHHMMQ